jgi:TPP-dependent 2-oxoacid decarboxylase
VTITKTRFTVEGKVHSGKACYDSVQNWCHKLVSKILNNKIYKAVILSTLCVVVREDYKSKVLENSTDETD